MTLLSLRHHFKTFFHLAEEQVELMVSNSTRSVQSTHDTYLSLIADHERTDELASFCHTMKGLLLNMGQPPWAEVAEQAEHAARSGALQRCHQLLDDIFDGLREVREKHP